MLAELYVENFALIEQSRVQLGEGLNAITGETGMANGFTVGKVHVGGRSGGGVSGQANMLIAPAAMAYLEQTGLLACHADVADWGWP